MSGASVGQPQPQQVPGQQLVVLDGLGTDQGRAWIACNTLILTPTARGCGARGRPRPPTGRGDTTTISAMIGSRYWSTPGIERPSEVTRRATGRASRPAPPMTCHTVKVRGGQTERTGDGVEHRADDGDEPGEDDRPAVAVAVQRMARPDHGLRRSRRRAAVGERVPRSTPDQIPGLSAEQGARPPRPPAPTATAAAGATRRRAELSRPAVNSSESPGRKNPPTGRSRRTGPGRSRSQTTLSADT